MNFLELCQSTAKESGTIEGDARPTSVLNQIGRLAKIVRWTAQAYEAIQNSRSDWRWMRAEFEKQTNPGQARYAAGSWAIDRFADWVYDGSYEESGFSVYETARGPADESTLRFLPWDEFYRYKLRGAQIPQRPVFFSVSDSGEFVLSPTPDKAYTVRGRYRKTPQILVADTDVPEMPVAHHPLIWRQALVYLADSDESVYQNPLWRMWVAESRGNLNRDQLPRAFISAGPLA